MNFRRTTVTAVSAIIALVTLATTSPALADEVDPQAPVVVDDAITIWPGGSAQVDVLANDSDPAGDDLALCRLPAAPGPGVRTPVTVMDMSWLMGEGQPLWVEAAPNARGTHTIEYYVCNHTRLTLAHLTVTIRPVAPVTVVKVAGKPGVLKVTNHNDGRIYFLATDRTGCKSDGQALVPAHATKLVRVQRHRINWTAFIGRGGVADRGRVRGIALNAPAAPDGNPHSSCSIGVAF